MSDNMNENEQDLQSKIEILEKDNKNLIEDLANGMKNQADLLIKNMELDTQNKELKEENERLQQQVKDVEKSAIQLMDKIFEKQISTEE